MNGNTNSKSVFADLSVINGWSSQIENINNEAIELLNTLTTKINSLEDYWVGNCASGFIEDSNNLIENVKKTHNDMRSMPAGLNELIRVMENQ